LKIVYNLWQLSEPQLTHELDKLTKWFDDGTLIAINPVERTGGISLLINDGYIVHAMRGDRKMYEITTKGALFWEIGGYQGAINRENAENTRVKALERFQKENANRMTYLTAILASFAFLSVFLQSLDKFHILFRIDIWLAFLLYLTGIISGIMI
jgi:hypothetical protein